MDDLWSVIVYIINEVVNPKPTSTLIPLCCGANTVYYSLSFSEKHFRHLWHVSLYATNPSTLSYLPYHSFFGVFFIIKPPDFKIKILINKIEI